jgi:DNA-binding transcriptional ArsR family regulator
VAVDTLSRAFAALADPTRRAILARLADGEATVGELAAPFPISQQAVSAHLKVLEQAGLISRGRSAQSRPCRLAVDNLDAAADWITRHRDLWAQRHDRLDAHLERLRATGTSDSAATNGSAATTDSAGTGHSAGTGR